MPSAPWRVPLGRALDQHRDLPQVRYVQLATVRADGRPANRTVVFRGFLGDGDALQFATDARSAKVEQLAHRPWAEACWYFPETREQFRLAGPIALVGADHPDPALLDARRALWRSLSDEARLAFAWPTPAEARAGPESFRPDPPDPQEPPPTFALALLDPIEVDHLELLGRPQDRRLYRRDEASTWTVREINP